MSQALYYNSGSEDQGSMAGPLAATAGWVGVGFLDNWLKSDKFLGKNRGLYNKVRNTSGSARDLAFNQYYNKKFKKKISMPSKARTAWMNNAKTAVWKKSASTVTSRVLGVANFMFLAPMLYGAAYHGFKGIQRLGYELERPEMNAGHVTLNAMAATDRQRALQAMHNSEFNGRSAMGQEAFLYHR